VDENCQIHQRIVFRVHELTTKALLIMSGRQFHHSSFSMFKFLLKPIKFTTNLFSTRFSSDSSTPSTLPQTSPQLHTPHYLSP
jgi:hypothetical protein